jgi:hypothetical protein
MLLSQSELIPTAVFAMSTEPQLIKDRVFSAKYEGKFGGTDDVL